jgi:hypothetical protein
MFGNIFGTPKERRTQLHFRDDGSAEFRLLDIEDTFLVEKDKDGEITRGWKHFYKNQFPFAGYKGIKPDQVTLGYDRDIILDPYNLVEKDKDNPNQSKKVLTDVVNKHKQVTGVQAWLSDVGEARRLKLMAKRSTKSNYNKIIWFLGGTLMFELIIIGIEVLMRQ